MSDLKIAVIFAAIDRISEVAGRMGQNITGLTDKIAAAGERLSHYGERMALTGQIIGDGAEKFARIGEAIVEPAAGMEDAINRLRANTMLVPPEIDRIHDAALRFSESNPALSAEGYVKAFEPAYEVFHNTAQALDAAAVAGKVAYLSHTDAASAGGLLAEVYTNLGVRAQRTGDMLQRTVQLAGISAPEQFARSVGRLSALARVTGSDLAQVFAIAAKAGQMMPGRGAMQITSMLQEFVDLTASGKTGINRNLDLLGQLGELHGRLAGYSPMQQVGALKAMGLEGGPQMVAFLDQLGKVAEMQETIAASGGTLDKAFVVATPGYTAQAERLAHVWENLRESIGTPALGALASVLERIAPIMERIGSAAENHPLIAKWFTLAIVGTGALGLAASHGMSIVGAMLNVFGSGLGVIGSFGSALASIGEVIAGVTGLSLGVVALIPLAAAAVGLLAYEIYKHWHAIYDAGANLMKFLGSGILAGIEYPIHAIAEVAARIRAHLPFSPAREGPLRDLHRVRIVETIAESIRSAPAAAAMAMALSPLMLGAPGAGHGGVVINYSPQVTISAGAAAGPDLKRVILEALRESSRELHDIIDHENERRERRAF